MYYPQKSERLRWIPRPGTEHVCYSKRVEPDLITITMPSLTGLISPREVNNLPLATEHSLLPPSRYVDVVIQVQNSVAVTSYTNGSWGSN